MNLDEPNRSVMTKERETKKKNVSTEEVLETSIVSLVSLYLNKIIHEQYLNKKIEYYFEKSEQARCASDQKKALQIITILPFPVVYFSKFKIMIIPKAC